MRDLISAFRAAAKERMTAAGWHKHSNGIYTLHLDEDFHAWLGLNTATKFHPLKVNPVIGLRYEPLERLLLELMETKPTPSATLSTPIGYLTPENHFLQLEIAEEHQAGPAAQRLEQLVTDYGLPFARRFANPDALLSALHATNFVANPERKALLIPTLYMVRGETAEARAQLAGGSATYGTETTAVANEYRRFADRLATRLDTVD